MSVYATNPKSHYDYQILETFEAGILLSGHEVKAIKTGRVSITGSYVKVLNGQLYLIGATIPPYQPNNVPENYDQQRTRKLLVKKSEINRLIGKSQESGLTLVPIKIYSKNNLIKIEIGLGRGKKKYDKREVIKKRESLREIKRKIKTAV